MESLRTINVQNINLCAIENKDLRGSANSVIYVFRLNRIRMVFVSSLKSLERSFPSQLCLVILKYI